ncbi:MAG: acyltransferase family protein [Pseudomonadota bacterium]
MEVQKQNRPARNQAIELLRTGAALGIVAFHAAIDGAAVFYAGLVVFLFLASMMEVGPNWERPRTAPQLARRLLIPFVFWYLVYLAANVAFGRPPFPSLHPLTVIFAGPSVHLWFLPFIFAVLVLLNVAKRRVSAQGVLLVAATLAAVVLAAASWWRPVAGEFPVPVPQWAHAAAAVLLGAAFGAAGRNRGKAATVIAGVIILAGLAALVVWPAPGVTAAYLIGVAGCTAAVALKQWVPERWNVQPVADCMFGVYLIHVLALAAGGLVLPKNGLVLVMAAFAGSLLVVYVARKYLPVTRWVLG